VEALAAFDVESSNVVTESMRGAKGFFEQMVHKVQDFFGGIWNKIQNIFSPASAE
jgi:serine-type D-ala-D-ala carboxypeptidase